MIETILIIIAGFIILLFIYFLDKKYRPQALPSPSPISSTARYQLPPDIADFTGRQEEVARAITFLRSAAEGASPAVVILVVAGMPGVGKSALAIHVAHRLKDRFPDAQLYVNLRDAEGNPRNPAEVLAEFLRALGVADEFIKGKGLEELSDFYRTRLDKKRALVLLDNAHDEAQVRPLLPGSPTCAVLITSRRRLDALEGAEILELQVMKEAEALELLEKLIGIERVRAEAEAAKRIVKLCGYLPLAVRIVGGTLRGRPHWTLNEYVGYLSDERWRLERLRVGDLEVRASIALSYRELSAEDARLFRLLGLLRGADFASPAAAHLLGVEEERGREALERLVEAQLLEPAGGGRYRFHDLVRLFARERLEEEEPQAAREAACLRVARWLDAQADVWVAWLMQRDRITEALMAFEWERENLVAAVEWAYQGREWSLAVHLAENLARFFEIRGYLGYLDDWERTHQYALEAARRAGDPHGEAHMLNNLGTVYRLRGQWAEAIECYKASLHLFQVLGDRHGEGETLKNIGVIYWRQGRWEEAIKMYEASLRIYRELGDRHGESKILNNLGLVYTNQGRLDEAIKMYEESLRICQELGDRHGESIALDNLGDVYFRQGRWAEAIEMYEASLRIFRELGDRLGEGVTLIGLGNVYTQQGRWAEAIEMYEASLRLFRALGNRYREGTTLMHMGELYEKQGQLEQAMALYQEALAKLPPDSPEYERVQERVMNLRGIAAG
jgi:tetratricopeptide (TPR) repeat protein